MSTGERARESGLLAGEVAELLGLGVQTLHFYERRGLIPPPPRSPSGYRLYGADTVERLRFIRKAQALGLDLDAIYEILVLAARGASPCGTVQARLAERLREVDARLAELRSFRGDLARLLTQAGELGAHCAEAQVCSIVEGAPALSVPEAAKAPIARKRRPADRREWRRSR